MKKSLYTFVLLLLSFVVLSGASPSNSPEDDIPSKNKILSSPKPRNAHSARGHQTSQAKRSARVLVRR